MPCENLLGICLYMFPRRLEIDHRGHTGICIRGGIPLGDELFAWKMAELPISPWSVRIMIHAACIKVKWVEELCQPPPQIKTGKHNNCCFKCGSNLQSNTNPATQLP